MTGYFGTPPKNHAQRGASAVRLGSGASQAAKSGKSYAATGTEYAFRRAREVREARVGRYPTYTRSTYGLVKARMVAK